MRSISIQPAVDVQVRSDEREMARVKVQICYDRLNIPAIISPSLQVHMPEITLGNASITEMECTDIELPDITLVFLEVISGAIVEFDSPFITISQYHIQVVTAIRASMTFATCEGYDIEASGT